MLARLDAYGASLVSRIGEAFAGLSGSEAAALTQSAAGLTENLGRIRAGIEDGSLRGDTLQAAIQGSLDLVRQDLAAARTKDRAAAGESSQSEPLPGASAGAEALAPAASRPDAAPVAADQDVRDEGQLQAATSLRRYQTFVGDIANRVGNMNIEGLSTERADALKEAQAAFTSASTRLESAFFENGDFDRGTFYGLLSASLGRLQQQVKELQSGTERQSARLYDSKTGTESLSDNQRRVRFDRTV